MKIVKISGGLGNQMFQYAFARALEEQSGEPVELDLTTYEYLPAHNGFELDKIFPVKFTEASVEDIDRLGTRPTSLSKRIRRKYLTKPTHFIDRGFSYDSEVFRLQGDRYLEGYWQSEKYFAPIADRMRAEFTFVADPGKRNSDLVASLQERRQEGMVPVSIHVRRGDSLRCSTSMVCTNEYYRNALALVHQKIQKPLFVVFSDDIPWCRQSLDLGRSESLYVDWNKGTDSWKDMWLMSQCEAHIIANSSFSWWGAWLDPNPEKLVIAPERWFALKSQRTSYYRLDFSDVLPENWVRVPVDTMRILHVVTNADLGGAPRVVTELANRAVAAGYSCAAASVPVGPFWDHLESRVERLPLRHLRRTLDPLQDFLAVLELVSIFRHWKPDIVHVHSSKAGILGRIAALLTSPGIATVYTIHGFDTILKTHRAFLPLEKAMARCTSAIVPVSSYDEANLRKVGIAGAGVMARVEAGSGRDDAKAPLVRLIHNGASDRLGAIPQAAIAARIEAARASGALIVLTIARLEEPKRFDLFVEVARRFSGDQNQHRKPSQNQEQSLGKALAKVSFFWIGNVQSVDPAQLPPNVEMLGEVPEAGNSINLCDIFLLLSAYEGLPMSILEAMSCAKPVVASNVGGIGEAVGTDGKAGILVPNDVDSVVMALSCLAVDPDLRAAMGHAARQRYEAGFSAETMWQAYLELYQNLYEARHGVV